jgi:cytochrome c peroxidase
MAGPRCGSIRLTDLGRGLITGKWKQLGRFKGPILRGMPARAPFFHNGFGTDPSKVLDFYEDRFGFVLTSQQRADLIDFLNVL